MEKVQVPSVIKADGCEITRKELENILLSSESIGNELKEMDQFGCSWYAPNLRMQSDAAEPHRRCGRYAEGVINLKLNDAIP